MARINPLNQSLDLAEARSVPLDRVLSSSGRIRILALLSEVEELHLTEIAKRTDQSYSATARHLDELSEAGIVKERDYGRMRVFRLNLFNSKAKIVQELVHRWNRSQDFEAFQAQA